MNRPLIRCDIFCVVVDNLGDAGVCWRLARQLATEHSWQVRLIIDRPEVLPPLVPDLPAQPVQVCPWGEADTAAAAGRWQPGEVVIEAFACALPESVLAAMAARPRPPVWLNLEYLSAEAWIDDCHGLASPHPTLPLIKHFYFPGFSAASGGLLHEADYAARRTAFDPRAWWQQMGLPPRRPGEKALSLFSYPHAPRDALFAALSTLGRPLSVLLPGDAGPARTIGAVRLLPLPFRSQRDYDELLWAADLNLVRGEDSFVRAQLAGRPMLWHIYPQAEDAHLAKLDAFLARYPGTPPWQALTRWWNGAAATPPEGALAPLLDGALDRAATDWSAALLARPGLAVELASFCRARLE